MSDKLVLVDDIARMGRLALHSARGQLGELLGGGRLAAEIGAVCDLKSFAKISARTNIIPLQ